jgi:HAD superfamily hydrolase (TIGR01509 family)
MMTEERCIMTYQVVFFDLDGIIFDSYDLWDKAIENLLYDYGVSYTQVIKKTLWEIPMTQANKYLKSLIEDSINDNLFESQKMQYLRSLYKHVELIDNAETVLKTLHFQNVPIYGVTANYFELAKVGLEANGIFAYFNGLYSSMEDGKGEKDSAFLKAICEKEKLNLSDILFVEDNQNNLKIAQTLGIDGIFYDSDSNPMTKINDDFPIIEKLSQLLHYFKGDK